MRNKTEKLIIMRVYKQNNKMIVYLPLEVTKGLNLEENDEVEFFKYNDRSFIIAKKADVANMLMGKEGGQRQQQQQRSGNEQRRPQPQPLSPGRVPFSKIPSISPEELHVLKKLDTLRFNQRTEDGVAKILNAQEKQVLERMIKFKIVGLFKKDGINVYSIPKSVYDTFLMRNKPERREEPAAAPRAAPQQQPSRQSPSFQRPTTGPVDIDRSPEVKELEEKGFLVLPTESEAARVSLMLEDSIRRGMVLGTRSFNKNREFFVVTRWFLDRHIPTVFKLLREGDKRVSEMAVEAKIPEEAARSILYILAENGEVREKRKDLFAIA